MIPDAAQAILSRLALPASTVLSPGAGSWWQPLCVVG
jgi:hypothetical protein